MGFKVTGGGGGGGGRRRCCGRGLGRRRFGWSRHELEGVPAQLWERAVFEFLQQVQLYDGVVAGQLIRYFLLPGAALAPGRVLALARGGVLAPGRVSPARPRLNCSTRFTSRTSDTAPRTPAPHFSMCPVAFMVSNISQQPAVTPARGFHPRQC